LSWASSMASNGQPYGDKFLWNEGCTS
jgi:hypothetical protein